MIPKHLLDPQRSIRTFKNFHQGFPWRGIQGDGISFMVGNAPFDPSFIIKLLPLRDLSLPVQSKFTEFDAYIADVRKNLHLGNHIQAVAINTMNRDGKDSYVQGKISKILVDYQNMRIRIFVTKPGTNDIVEVYPETIAMKYDTAYESMMPVFDDYQDALEYNTSLFEILI